MEKIVKLQLADSRSVVPIFALGIRYMYIRTYSMFSKHISAHINFLAYNIHVHCKFYIMVDKT